MLGYQLTLHLPGSHTLHLPTLFTPPTLPRLTYVRVSANLGWIIFAPFMLLLSPIPPFLRFLTLLTRPTPPRLTFFRVSADSGWIIFAPFIFLLSVCINCVVIPIIDVFMLGFDVIAYFMSPK